MHCNPERDYLLLSLYRNIKACRCTDKEDIWQQMSFAGPNTAIQTDLDPLSHLGFVEAKRAA